MNGANNKKKNTAENYWGIGKPEILAGLSTNTELLVFVYQNT